MEQQVSQEHEGRHEPDGVAADVFGKILENGSQTKKNRDEEEHA